MAAPSVTIYPPEADQAGCTAQCIVINSQSGTGYRLEQYEASASAVTGWKFKCFTWHTSFVNNTNPHIGGPSFEADCKSEDYTSPIQYGYAPDNPDLGTLELRYYWLNFDDTQVSSGTEEYTVTNLVAVFEKDIGTVDVSVFNGRGGVVSDGVHTGTSFSVTLPKGTVVTLTATPRQGFRFRKFKSSVFSIYDNPYQFTVKGNVSYVAFFCSDLLVNSSTVGSPVRLVYDDRPGGTGKLVADY